MCWNFPFSALPHREEPHRLREWVRSLPAAKAPSGPEAGVIPWVGFQNRTNCWADLGVCEAPQRLKIKLRLLWTAGRMIFLA